MTALGRDDLAVRVLGRLEATLGELPGDGGIRSAARVAGGFVVSRSTTPLKFNDERETSAYQ
jgi:hypothetical protein